MSNETFALRSTTRVKSTDTRIVQFISGDLDNAFVYRFGLIYQKYYSGSISVTHRSDVRTLFSFLELQCFRVSRIRSALCEVRRNRCWNKTLLKWIVLFFDPKYDIIWTPPQIKEIHIIVQQVNNLIRGRFDESRTARDLEKQKAVAAVKFCYASDFESIYIMLKSLTKLSVRDLESVVTRSMSIFTHLFPLRMSTPENLIVEDIVNSRIEGGVVILDHFDSKRKNSVLRAYPAWVGTFFYTYIRYMSKMVLNFGTASKIFFKPRSTAHGLDAGRITNLSRFLEKGFGGSPAAYVGGNRKRKVYMTLTHFEAEGNKSHENTRSVREKNYLLNLPTNEVNQLVRYSMNLGSELIRYEGGLPIWYTTLIQLPIEMIHPEMKGGE